MPTHDDLSSLPPAVLRAALVASEKREEKENEKEKLRREIRKLQKQLDELEEGGGGSEVELVASGSRHKAKRPRVDSPSDEEAVQDMRNRRWPIARMRMAGTIAVLPQRYVHSRGRILVMTQDLQSILHKMSKEGSSLRVGRELRQSKLPRLPTRVP